MVDAQAADDGYQERTRRANLLVAGLLPADECLLQHVFGIGYAPQHAVCDGEEEAAVLVERREPDLNFRIGKLLFDHRIALIVVWQYRLREYPPQTSSTLPQIELRATPKGRFQLPRPNGTLFCDNLAAHSSDIVTPAACREGGITEQTNYRWRKQSGGLQVDQARRLKGLVPLSTGADRPMHVSSTNRPGLSGSGRMVANPDITPVLG